MIIQQPSGIARQLILLFHGVGSTARDLAPLGEAQCGDRQRAGA
jgi:predicted esterase